MTVAALVVAAPTTGHAGAPVPAAEDPASVLGGKTAPISTNSLVCDGDGNSGRRVQLIYVRGDAGARLQPRRPQVHLLARLRRLRTRVRQRRRRPCGRRQPVQRRSALRRGRHELLDLAGGDENQVDCNLDDYFNANPPAGSYLATRWNVARSLYLVAGGDVPGTGPVNGAVYVLTNGGSGKAIDVQGGFEGNPYERWTLN